MPIVRFAKAHAVSMASLFLFLTAAGILLFTRFGVFLVFDIIGDFRETDNFSSTARSAPVSVTHWLSVPENIVLPKEISQVSGIFVTDANLVLSTDQSEIFVLSKDGSKVIDGGNLFRFTPLLLRQGRLEVVTMVGDEFWLAGEHGAFVAASTSGEFLGDRPMPLAAASKEITGFSNGDDIYFLTTNDSVDLTVLDPNSDQVRTLKLDFGGAPEPDEFLWSGVAYSDGNLFLVSENYPMVIVADSNTGTVKATLGIEGEHEFSGISVRDGNIYLTSDHNYFDLRPPLKVYQLPEELMGGL